ncbi:hypothetical protein ACMYSQ_002530 [Aspergillus niger]
MSTTTTPTKPTRITPDEQLHFLLSCIRHSNSGKIDFTTVAKECSIVTKAAAYVHPQPSILYITY